MSLLLQSSFVLLVGAFDFVCSVFGTRVDSALLLVILLSIVTGFLMTLVYRYASNQAAIRIEKDRIKANLLAVRVYRDELSVVAQSYGRVLSGTVRYLKYSLRPLLFSGIPLIILVVQADRYLGFEPLRTGQPFLVSVVSATASEKVAIHTPAGLEITAAPVHIADENKVVWRLSATKEGQYDVIIEADGQSFEKQVVASSRLTRLSQFRLQAPWWKRIWVSAEPALPRGSMIESIEVGYPFRYIDFAWMQWNWVWLLLVLSVASGFVFKWVLGVEI